MIDENLNYDDLDDDADDDDDDSQDDQVKG